MNPSPAKPVAPPAAGPLRQGQVCGPVAALLHGVHVQPWAHDFFTLMRRLDALQPHAPRTGQAQRPGQEILRLAQATELNFAPAPLQQLELRADAPPRLSVRFFGLLGPQGPMPTHFTEYVRDRVHHHGDSAAAHFLDMFHHRFLTLFYRSWAQAQAVVHADRPHDDRYLVWLGSATGLPQGMPTSATSAAAGLPAQALAFQAGLLASRSRHPEALCKVLQHYFGVGVQVQSHVGQWLAMEAQDRTRLGFASNRPERHGAPAPQLARNANAGSKVWDRQNRFRLQIGPLNLVEYQRLLPGSPDWAPLLQWMGLLASPHLDWDLELQLRLELRPVVALRSRVLRLGVNTWLPRPCSHLAGRHQGNTHLRINPKTSFLQRRSLWSGTRNAAASSPLVAAPPIAPGLGGQAPATGS